MVFLPYRVLVYAASNLHVLGITLTNELLDPPNLNNEEKNLLLWQWLP